MNGRKQQRVSIQEEEEEEEEDDDEEEEEEEEEKKKRKRKKKKNCGLHSLKNKPQSAETRNLINYSP